MIGFADPIQTERLLHYYTQQGVKSVTVLINKRDRSKAKPVLAQISRSKVQTVNEADFPRWFRQHALQDLSLVLPVPFQPATFPFAPQQFGADLNLHYSLYSQWFQLGFRRITLYYNNHFFQPRVNHVLDTMVNRHKNQRCVIIGNGPSLNELDMSRLKSEITFSSNRAYLGYKKWGFQPTYWGVFDKLQAEKYYKEWETEIPKNIIKFFPFQYTQLMNMDNACPVPALYETLESLAARTNLQAPTAVHASHTVTVSFLHLALIMGCNPIYLIGVDHNYPPEILASTYRSGFNFVPKYLKNLIIWSPRIRACFPTGIVERFEQSLASKRCQTWTTGTTSAQTHFSTAYTQQKEFICPRPKATEDAFTIFHDWAQTRHIEIYNATPGTKLEVFPKIRYEAIFEKNSHV